MSKKLTEQQIKVLALNRQIPYHHLRAVIEVESRGSGFLKDGRPVILFERHIFYKESGKYPVSKFCPEVSNKKPGGYMGYEDEWIRMGVAQSIMQLLGADITTATKAAHHSCSWGLGQIMGFNHKLAGFRNLNDFVKAVHESELRQLEAMLTFIDANARMGKALREGDWPTFKRLYNGPGKNNYVELLQAAHDKWK